MLLNINPYAVRGETAADALTEAERADLQRLIQVFTSHVSSNTVKKKYYEGKISLSSVNLGIALPQELSRLEIGCAWGAKTVDVLAGLSMFDGFVDENGQAADEINEIVRANRLVDAYNKSSRDELLFGCTFATLSGDDEIGCKIRYHSPMTAAGLWDGEKDRIACGLAVIDTAPDSTVENVWSPSLVNYYRDDCILVMRRTGSAWTAKRHAHQMGRPMMEPMVWNATSDKPFGRSRLKAPVRRLIQGYVRTIANATIGLEFATSPQKYLLGVTDKQYDAVVSQKFRQYVGSILTSTANPETGENPVFGQLPQGNITPHVEMIRILATQFSAATGLTVTDTGVVNDANPTSSDAILAQSRTLTGMAEQLNTGNGEALQRIALMALAIKNNCTMEELSEEQRAVMPHFKNPAMPSVAVTADAAVKIASVRQDFADTDVFLEMLGFSQADIRRIRAGEQRSRGRRTIEEMDLE